MGTCFSKKTHRQHPYQPISSKQTIHYLPPTKNTATTTQTPTQYCPKQLHKQPSSPAPPLIALPPAPTSPPPEEEQGLGFHLTTKSRPPPVRVSQLGPRQVRIEQANSKAQALHKQATIETLQADSKEKEKMKTPSPSPINFSPVVVRVQASPVLITQSNSCQGTNPTLFNSVVHLNNYKHIHIVKRPSLLEQSAAVANLQNPNNLSKVFKSEFNLHSSSQYQVNFHKMPQRVAISG